MAITITTLNNSTSVAKTFSELGKTLNESRWINTTDDAPNYHVYLNVRNQVAGLDKKKSPLMRINAQVVVSLPTTVVNSAGGEQAIDEQVVINVTCTRPRLSGVLTDTHLKDARAFLVNFLSEANLLALMRGEV